MQIATDNEFRLTSIGWSHQDYDENENISMIRLIIDEVGENTLAADDDPWYSALSAAFKKHNLQVLIMLTMVIMGIVMMVIVVVLPCNKFSFR